MTAAQDDGTQLDPVVPLDDDVDDVPVLGSSDDALGAPGVDTTGSLGANSTEVGTPGFGTPFTPGFQRPAGCGFENMGGDGQTCADWNEIMVGVWVCEYGEYKAGDDYNMDACECEDYKGCSNAAYYGAYYVDIRGDCVPWNDDAATVCGGDNNMACDTLGGWRPDEIANAGTYRQDNGHKGEQLFDMPYGAIKFEIHPDDYDKNGLDVHSVKLWIGNEDYCMGPTPEGTLYDAWDDNRWDTAGGAKKGAPGWWVPSNGENHVKSLRPFVDFFDWYENTGEWTPSRESGKFSGVGVKMNVWPDRHMAHPYDQEIDIKKIGPDGNLPDHTWQKAEDQVWCLQDPHAGDFSKAWSRGWGDNFPYGKGGHYPYVPVGSVQLGLTDAAMCQLSREDFCNSIDKEDTCLMVRFYNMDDGAYDMVPPDRVDEWFAETYIKMTHLCDENEFAFCINIGDGSIEDEFYQDTDYGVCNDGWFTDHDGNKFLGSVVDESDPFNIVYDPRLWFTNYIVEIHDDCGWAG